jgi:hypothetical protein
VAFSTIDEARSWITKKQVENMATTRTLQSGVKIKKNEILMRKSSMLKYLTIEFKILFTIKLSLPFFVNLKLICQESQKTILYLWKEIRKELNYRLFVCTISNLYLCLHLVFLKGVLILQDQYRATIQYSFSKEQDSHFDKVQTDWYCGRCGIFNFKRRDNCFKCSASREESGSEGFDEISNILTKS